MKIADKAKALLDSDISRYQISQDTGISQSVLSRMASEESPIDQRATKTVQLLADYYDAMVINLGLQARNMPTNGDDPRVAELRQFRAKFQAWGEKTYAEMSEQDHEFADAFAQMFEDTMNDGVGIGRAMLAWVDQNFESDKK